MGSQKKKLKKAADILTRTAIPLVSIDDLESVVEDARRKRTEEGKEIDGVKVRVAFNLAGIWTMILSTGYEGGSAHWHCSAKLWPDGRSSTSEDWQNLGSLLHRVVTLSGADPEKVRPIELTPEETTHPNRPRHYCWHEDGSECVVAEGLKRAIALMYETEARVQN